MSHSTFKTRFTRALREQFIQSGAWRDQTFYHHIELRAKQHPDRVVFIDEHRSITYAQLKDQIDRCAHFLRSIGIGAGDVVELLGRDDALTRHVFHPL